MMINRVQTKTDSDTIHCLVNPEPITVKGIKTFHPTFFHIYSGKKGVIYSFRAVEEKRGGTALGAIFKKTMKQERQDKWMGKVGSPKGLLRNDPNSIRTRTKREMNLDTIREKLAYDLFQELGRGFFLVPKTRLSLQPIMDPFNRYNVLAQCWVQDGITDSLRIMSSFLKGYSDLAKANTLDKGKKISFMKFLEKHHRPPETILAPDGESVPLKGIMELLAVGRCLADVDLLGGGGLNAGFIWIKKKKKIVSARAVKIDPGYAFTFTHEDPKNASENLVINTQKKLGGMRYHLEDLRDIQTSTGNHDSIVQWKSLTKKQQEKFTASLLNCARYLRSKKVLNLLFYREGKFTYPEASHSSVAQIPKELAEQMYREMKEWIRSQLEIYDQPLKSFEKKYPEQLLRIYYLDELGEISLPMTKETFPIRELFTELILIEDKEEKKDLTPIKGDHLNLAPKTISLAGMFQDHRRILVLGGAGIGKSTLCQKIAHDWASGRLWKNTFKAVYWIPLRLLNDLDLKEEAGFPLEIIIPHLFSHAFDPSKKILLILDGYDEATEQLSKRVDILLKHTPFHILVTSRPGKTDLLEVDQKIENIGFSDEHMQIYINYFSNRKRKEVTHTLTGNELFSKIKENPCLYPIAHIPLQLQMILSIYKKTGSLQHASSLTGLYRFMTSELYDWHLRGQKKEEKENHLLQLGEIAALGLETGQLVIPSKKVKHLLQDSLLETGMLKKIHGDELTYFFVHLTFQEYLIALYIHSKSTQEQQKFILEKRSEPSYKLVLAFLAGLNYSQKQTSIEQFFSILFQKPHTMKKSHLLELMLYCLNECTGFKKPLLPFETLVKENPHIWNTCLSDGYTPLLFAANQRQNQAFYWLVNRYPDLLDKAGKWARSKSITVTPFLICAEKGNLEILKWLNKKNPQLISKCKNPNYTPLHFAAVNGHIEVMKFLLERKTQLIFLEDSAPDFTPLHVAALNGRVEAVRLLLEKDPELISKYDKNGQTPLHVAALTGQIEVMKLLLEKDPELISKYDTNGQTPLHFAALTGQIEVMKLLLEKDPQLISKYDKDGITSLYFAAYGGHIKAMKFLLETDPQLILKYDIKGFTPLHEAARDGHVEAMEFLLEKDPQLIFKCDKNGHTPLHYAAWNGHVEAGKYLFQQQPSLLNCVDNDDKTALMLAKKNSQVKFLNWIQSVGGKE